MKNDGEKISMLTAYDYSFAKIIDNAGIDIILVGDSASIVMAGHETPLPITLDQMIYNSWHANCYKAFALFQELKRLVFSLNDPNIFIEFTR